VAVTDSRHSEPDSLNASEAFAHATAVIRKAPERALAIALWEYGLFCGLNLAAILAFPVLVQVQVSGPEAMNPAMMPAIMAAQGLLAVGSLIVVVLIEPAWQRLYARGETGDRFLFRIGPDEGRFGLAILTQLGLGVGFWIVAAIAGGLVYGAVTLTQGTGPILSVLVPTIAAILAVPPALAVLLFVICLSLPLFAGMVARQDFNPFGHARAALKALLPTGRIVGYFILTFIAVLVGVGLITLPFRLLFMLFSGEETNRVIAALSMLLTFVSSLFIHFVVANLSRGIGAYLALHFSGRTNPLLADPSGPETAPDAAPTVARNDG